MGRRIPPQLCARCKGYKKLCGLSTCPILEKFRLQAAAVSRLQRGREVEGATPPSIVVGEAGYPRVPILFNIPPETYGEDAHLYDAPEVWRETRPSLRELLRLRSGLVASLTRLDARNPWRLYEKEFSLAAVSERAVESRAVLAKPPLPSLRFDGILAPQGPTAPAERIDVEGSPKPPRRLEKLIWDDAKSSDAIIELYQSGLDIYLLIRALSLGLLGRLRSRRLVPTRWAITAVDQTISNKLLHEVRTYDTINYVEVYHGGYLGNYFTVILIPGSYEAEMIEVWHPLTPWTRVTSRPVSFRIVEYPSLRIEPLDGGYIAARLAVAEHLYRRRRQAKVLIVREITRDYYAPVGNWHIRETVRRILSSKPIATLDDVDSAIPIVEKLAKSREAAVEARNSRLLRKIRSSATLDMFLKR
ncbi:hypothetical protein Pyrde_1106 [Pyrodictium delaneyi]|uniref:DNA repair protein n=1 Tax=Pyrodictium delaneyi TaxID=1273541 RepID=A0A0P0N3Q1_9CREN|nr:Nre family DNA repair protein [Pyrodictium delaneyi]ALL01154.1 hypothetical protein Pyrde_1106 [Pyrodictium delaneyi]OWJ55272.1 hypothetical protein Pdsh_00110 [Pyrodictium delaneyi]